MKESKLPDSIPVEDTFQFQAYDKVFKPAMKFYLIKYERDNHRLRKKIEDERQKIKDRIKSTDNEVELRDKTANACSFHGIS